MILKGTETLPRYPWIQGSDKMGIPSYGSITNRFSDGIPTYKADPASMHRLASVGWKTVGSGSSYIYVRYVGSKQNQEVA